MSSAIETTTTTVSIQEAATPLVRVIPFALRLPPSVLVESSSASASTEPSSSVNPQLTMALQLDPTGIVGTITILNKTVLLWFGWGKLEQPMDSSSSNTNAAVEEGTNSFCTFEKTTKNFA